MDWSTEYHVIELLSLFGLGLVRYIYIRLKLNTSSIELQLVSDFLKN